MKELQDYRDEIDKIDDEICSLLEKRKNVVQKILEYKKEHNFEIEDYERE